MDQQPPPQRESKFKDLYEFVAFIRDAIDDGKLESQFPGITRGISMAQREEMLIDQFAELSGFPTGEAWRQWLKGSDRIYGEQDVILLDDLNKKMSPPMLMLRLPVSASKPSQTMNLLLNCRKEICKDIARHQGYVRRVFSNSDKTLIIREESDSKKMMGMISPMMGGVKGNWMSTGYLFSEWCNGGMAEYH